jgi:hypothetical protein
VTFVGQGALRRIVLRDDEVRRGRCSRVSALPSPPSDPDPR